MHAVRAAARGGQDKQVHLPMHGLAQHTQACAHPPPAPELAGVKGREEAQRAHGKAHHRRQRHVLGEQRRHVPAAACAGARVSTEQSWQVTTHQRQQPKQQAAHHSSTPSNSSSSVGLQPAFGAHSTVPSPPRVMAKSTLVVAGSNAAYCGISAATDRSTNTCKRVAQRAAVACMHAHNTR